MFKFINYSFLCLEIKSFTKIKFCKNLLFDQFKYLYMYNLKLLLKYYICLKNIYNTLIIQKKQNKYNIIINKYNIYIKLKKYNKVLKILNLFNIFDKYYFQKIKIKNIPTKLKNISLLKSPHVFKNAQNHYEYRTFKLIINIPIIIGFPTNYINNLIEKTIKFDNIYQIKMKRKKLLLFDDFLND